ncbi:MAG: hypothetical protein ACRDRT_17645, partial [Pseudonocardiaceae bacterium]
SSTTRGTNVRAAVTMAQRITPATITGHPPQGWVVGGPADHPPLASRRPPTAPANMPFDPRYDQQLCHSS